MELKSFIAVVSLLTVAWSQTAIATNNNGICNDLMKCVKPHLDDIITFKNALDLFEFNITFNDHWLQKACTLRDALKPCVDKSEQTWCRQASIHSDLALTLALTTTVCTNRDKIKTNLSCWTHSLLQTNLRWCYTQAQPTACRINAIQSITECFTPEVANVFIAIGKDFASFHKATATVPTWVVSST